jgi:glycosyltransferase involved in cell wall biosynthesis
MKILYIVNNLTFFISHRLQVAIMAKSLGYEILVLAGQSGSRQMQVDIDSIFSGNGIEYKVLNFFNTGSNIFFEVIGLYEIVSNIKKYNPNIIHCISTKGNFFGGISAFISGAQNIVFSISGMGYIFTNSAAFSFKKSTYRILYNTLFRGILNRLKSTVIVQNEDDRLHFDGLIYNSKSKVWLIKGGSGIHLDKFSDVEFGNKKNIILFPARVLAEKGIREFVAAANILSRSHNDWVYIVAGASDYKNPSAIKENEISSWLKNEKIKYIGYSRELLKLMKISKIVCLPSYREGMPKVLLEAAASGCAVVTTAVPGCREAIVPGVTGLMVPPYSVDDLVGALNQLMMHDETCLKYGAQGRVMAFTKFSINKVVAEHMKVYEDLAKKVRDEK